jgi:L-ascorbate metabolism protein UlaG (beta-lactamase superfamily)
VEDFMVRETLYRPGDATVIEPLVNKWVAWAHVIPPVAGSLHLLRYQMRLLESYLSDPQSHAATCQDPKFRSGPFVDIPAEKADDVREFLALTKHKQAANIQFAQSIFEFQNYLVEHAKGQSLEPFYEHLPPSLRGYVELLYDYYNRPIVRFLESLLYSSPYYQPELQSLRIFRETQDRYRPFIMSTPRLMQNNQVDWAIPFASPEVDEFFRLDSVPQPLGYIRTLLGLSPAEDRLVLQFLSDEPIRREEKWDDAGVRVRYLGHACVLIEWNGVSVLTDPCIGVMPERTEPDHMTYEDLPEKLDYVLITHNHHDHFCVETLLRLRHRIGCIVVPRSFGIFYGDLSLKLLCQKIGFKNVVELDALDSVALPDGEITAIPFMGEHADLPHAKTAYVVRAGNQQIMLAADSNCLDRRMYEHLRQILGPIETVFLGMECVGAPLSWTSGPFLPVMPEFAHEQSRRYNGCNSTRALDILEAVGAQRIYIYAMGLEPWLEHLLGLAYTDDAEQIKEAGLLLGHARRRGFAEAQLLYGKHEIILSPTNGWHDKLYFNEAAELQTMAQTEDQFTFE